MPKRDETKTYSYGGSLYGQGQPDGFSVADLDELAPLPEPKSKPDLPADFPARATFLKLGMGTVAVIAAMPDDELEKLEGIGKATVEKVAALPQVKALREAKA